MNQDERDRIVLWRELLEAHDALTKRFQAELKGEFGLSVPQYDALYRLSVAPDQVCRMGEVADAMLYSTGAATKVFDRLVERGLVQRSTDPEDRRTVLVQLTPEGRSLMQRAARAHGRSIVDALGPFDSATERAHVSGFLRRLKERETARARR